MTTAQKLQAFETHAIYQANLIYQQHMDKLSKEIQAETNEQTKRIKEDLDKKLENKYQQMLLNKNKRIATVKHTFEQGLSALQKGYHNTVLNKVRSDLYAFTKTDAYLLYLEKAVASLADTALELVITKEDEVHLGYLRKRFHDRIFARGDFIGGVVGHLPPNVLVDGSFLGALEELEGGSCAGFGDRRGRPL